jgi:hypothetical protein
MSRHGYIDDDCDDPWQLIRYRSCAAVLRTVVEESSG